MKLKVNAPLDPGFMPMSVVYRDFEAAVKAHKHVYCEKPAAPDAYGAVRMIKAAEGVKDLSLVMGFQVRHASAYDEMIRRIHRGDIGKVVAAQLYYNGGGGSGKKRRKGGSGAGSPRARRQRVV